jgi:two-component system sensor histidine kinase SenX3
MGSHSMKLSSKKVPSHVIATVAAFGGFTLVLTKRHRIVYASPLAKGLVPREGNLLVDPDLISVANAARASKELVARPFTLNSLGPFHEVVVQAAVVQGHWILMTVFDRTAEIQAVQIRRDFVSNIGHELRTPVTSVGLIAQALHSCASDPGAVEHFAGRLDHVARRLEALAEGMLALTEIQEGHPTLATEELHTNELVDRAVFQAMEAARIKGIKLKTKKRVDALIRGDGVALVTAIENLIANSIHYSTKGSRVTVSSETDDAEGTVKISVIDQGIGISPDEQDRVFERFYRTDSARSARAGGTGLGLAIVKHTVLAHGGLVAVDSQLGSGSTFTVTLPMLGSEPAEAASEKDRKP